MSKIKHANPLFQLLLQLYYTLSHWQFIVPFILNQSGSVVYVYLLGSTEISMAVPICNSLTFVFTAITAHILGEVPVYPFQTYGGMCLVLIGIAICIDSKN